MSSAKRLIKAVEQFTYESNRCLTISVGISQYEPTDNMESSIQRADIALYKANHEDQNCTQVST